MVREAEALAEVPAALELDGLILPSELVSVDEDHVVVRLEGDGQGAEAVVPLGDFRTAQSDQIEAKPGERFEVHVEQLSQDKTRWVASKDKVWRLRAFDRVREAYAAKAPVTGEVVGLVDGGYSVDLGVRAFLPSSQVGLRPPRRPDEVLGQELSFEIIRFDRARQNVVVSRRTLLEREQKDRLGRLKVGAIVDGTVRSFTDYGAFVDIGGGLDGLLHVEEMAWTRVRRPQDICEVGQTLRLEVIQIEKGKKRISLSLRRLQDDPWMDVAERFPVGSVVSGLVVSKTDFGCFLELERGLEGLVHSTGPLVESGDAAAIRKIDIGDEIRARIVDIELGARRLSLVLAHEEG